MQENEDRDKQQNIGILEILTIISFLWAIPGCRVSQWRGKLWTNRMGWLVFSFSALTETMSRLEYEGQIVP